MSNKTQLQTNNTALDALITRVNTAKNTAASLPEAGAGSGSGSIETCTVTINSVGISIYECLVTTMGAEGMRSSLYDMYTKSLTLQNVVKGTPIIIKTGIPVLPGYAISTSTDADIFVSDYMPSTNVSGMWYFQILASASDNVTITVREDD